MKHTETGEFWSLRVRGWLATSFVVSLMLAIGVTW